MPFQDMHPEVLKAVSRKGGMWRSKKGFAKMDPNKLKEVSLKGVQARRDHKGTKISKPSEVDSGRTELNLERILNALDNED